MPGPASTGSTSTASTSTTPAPSGIPGGRIPTPNEPGFPSPPPGAVVLAREAGARALGLALVPGSPRSLVRVSVLTGRGDGARGLPVSIRFGSDRAAPLAPCGAGCYQARLPTPRPGSRAEIRLGRKAYGVVLPGAIDPPGGARIVYRAEAVWRRLRTLVWHETLASTPTDALRTVYRAVAPDELEYMIENGSGSVIIGGKRWDRSSRGGRWVRSVQDPTLRQPVPFWVSPTDTRVLGSSRFAGQDVWVVSFFDPGTPGWFEARIAKRSGHTLTLTMIAVAHFMHHVYGPFDAPFRLHPPVGP